MDLIELKYHGLLRRAMEEQLTFAPDVETRNRKPLEQPAPFDAAWELRCGPDNRFSRLLRCGDGNADGRGSGDRDQRPQSAADWRPGVRPMRIAPLADVKARLSAYVDECGAEGPVVITRNGKAVAVLLAPSDDDDLERLMLESFAALPVAARPLTPEHQGGQRSSRRRILAGRSKTRQAAQGGGSTPRPAHPLMRFLPWRRPPACWPNPRPCPSPPRLVKGPRLDARRRDAYATPVTKQASHARSRPWYGTSAAAHSQ